MPGLPINRIRRLWPHAIQSIRTIALWLLESIAPSCCLLCRQKPEYRHGLCRNCWMTLPANKDHCERCALPMGQTGLCGCCQQRSPAFDSVIAPMCYQPPIDQILRALKYRQHLSFARTVAGLISDAVACAGAPRPDLLLGTPMTPHALRKRGFNQAAFVAHLIGRDLGIPVSASVLKKTRESERQSVLGAKERQINLKGAFHCTRLLQGKHIALIDDILTTGATANEASRMLKDAGAARVDIWVCARTGKF